MILYLFFYRKKLSCYHHFSIVSIFPDHGDVVQEIERYLHFPRITLASAIQTCIHTYMHKYIHTHVHSYTYIYTCIQAYTHTYACIQYCLHSSADPPFWLSFKISPITLFYSLQRDEKNEVEFLRFLSSFILYS